jgi:hypothetical protein
MKIAQAVVYLKYFKALIRNLHKIAMKERNMKAIKYEW